MPPQIKIPCTAPNSAHTQFQELNACFRVCFFVVHEIKCIIFLAKAQSIVPLLELSRICLTLFSVLHILRAFYAAPHCASHSMVHSNEKLRSVPKVCSTTILLIIQRANPLIKMCGKK